MIKPYFETERGILYQGNALDVLKGMESESIDCVMTSPPYWALRDYGVEGQLGLELTFQEYIEKLIYIFDEIKRVLKKTGTCWVNIGDTYGTQSGNMGNEVSKQPKYEVADSVMNFKQPAGIHKSLCQIPERFSIAMTDNGWIKRNTIIWYKPNCMPSSADDRFTVDFEYLYFFVKNQKYWFEQQFDKLADSTLNDTRMNDGFTQNRPHRGYIDGNNQQGSGLLKPNPQGRNKRCVWKIPTQSFPEAHFAVYPEQLCYTPIKAGCPESGTVLDPFTGAGTTLLVAEKLRRKNIGIEISKEYCDIAVNRIKKETAQLKLQL